MVLPAMTDGIPMTMKGNSFKITLNSGMRGAKMPPKRARLEQIPVIATEIKLEC